MTHVFISYKREDESRVGRLARALERAGIEVWWDRGLPGGESWHANIEANLDTAGCVIAVWSQGSVAPEGGYVRDEARRGLVRGILVPVLFDRIKDIPLGFGETQAIDLCHWRGDLRDQFFQDLVAAVRAKLDGQPVPKPRGPSLRVARRLAFGGASTAFLATIAAIALNTFGLTSRVCSIPGPQPTLSDMCGAVGLGGMPSRAERLAWAARPPGSCSALREHITRFPEGAYRSEAADLITARKVTYEDTWTKVTRGLAQFEPDDGPSAPNEAIAKSRALDRARPEAERLCRGFGAGTLYRFVSASSAAGSWHCDRGGRGVVCGFDGEAQCVLQSREQVEHEQCGPKT
jgi:TIR domain